MGLLVAILSALDRCFERKRDREANESTFISSDDGSRTKTNITPHISTSYISLFVDRNACLCHTAYPAAVDHTRTPSFKAQFSSRVADSLVGAHRWRLWNIQYLAFDTFRHTHGCVHVSASADKHTPLCEKMKLFLPKNNGAEGGVFCVTYGSVLLPRRSRLARYYSCFDTHTHTFVFVWIAFSRNFLRCVVISLSPRERG